MKFISYAGMPYGAAGGVRVRPVEPFSFHQSQRPMFCTAPGRGGVANEFHYAPALLPNPGHAVPTPVRAE